jgi:hypothetical protein
MHFSKTDRLLYSTRKNTVTSPFPLGHLLIKNEGGGGGNRAGIRLRCARLMRAHQMECQGRASGL